VSGLEKEAQRRIYGQDMSSAIGSIGMWFHIDVTLVLLLLLLL
jgi:hypothetical protein